MRRPMPPSQNIWLPRLPCRLVTEFRMLRLKFARGSEMKMSKKLVYGLMVAPCCAERPDVQEGGQVLGSDGEVYDGASPEQQAALVEQAKQEGWFGKKKTSGVQEAISISCLRMIWSSCL